MAILIAVLLAYLLQIAIWEGVGLGIVWIINHAFDVSLSYALVGGAIFGVWFVIILIHALIVYAAHKA